MRDNSEKEVNVRFMVSNDLHDKVRKIQGLFTFKEGKKTPIHEVYVRLIERGIVEISKQNRGL